MFAREDEKNARAAGSAGKEDFRPYRAIEGDLGLGVIILCDHAENTIPPEFDDLGLGEEELRRHIAYDPGAAAVAEALARKLGAPALLTCFSRLLIDPNRGPEDPTQIMQISDGVVIPGNLNLTPEEKAARVARFYDPYHQAIDLLIDEAIDLGKVPALLAVHSFTPAWKGVPRPWHATVLWDKDGRLPQPLLAGLKREEGLTVDENEPYSGELIGDTLNRHGTNRGIAHALVELRQDLLLDEEGQMEWADRLARIVGGILEDERVADSLASIQYGGSEGRHAGAGGEGSIPVPHEQPIKRPAASAGATAEIDERTQTELEAAAFRRLRDHLRSRTDVQNIDLMDLAGFCRNCLSNWYQEAAAKRGIGLTKDEAREIVYGMPYDDWKTRFQK